VQFWEEIPYSVAVVIKEYRERNAAKDYIEATVICERDSLDLPLGFPN
jgi:GTPase Era involved in 16S rRNA processing